MGGALRSSPPQIGRQVSLSHIAARTHHRARGQVTPIEVKWAGNPSLRDAHTSANFSRNKARKLRMIHYLPLLTPMQLHPQVTALPWLCL